MSTPLRVSEDLYREATAEGLLMNRSTAKQIEFWAQLGRRIAHSTTPAELLALMQGIAKVTIELPDSKPVDPARVFAEAEKACSAGIPAVKNNIYYEASPHRPGLLDQVMPDGSRRTGHFVDGRFVPE